jgi:hypothetical protein
MRWRHGPDQRDRVSAERSHIPRQSLDKPRSIQARDVDRGLAAEEDQRRHVWCYEVRMLRRANRKYPSRSSTSV